MSQIEEEVNRNLIKLHLSHCADCTITGDQVHTISSGERKRISIAFELITNPKVIMLDEPTSGLDSTSAYRVMKLMKNEAKQGKLVVATIHMPSSETFMLCDRVMLMSDGYCLYHGTIRDIKPYFARHFKAQPKSFTNPSDFLISIAHDPSRYNRELTHDRLV